MNKNILILLAVIILTSATTANIITAKPALPKSSITKVFHGGWRDSDAIDWIKSMTKRGYIVKCHSLGDERTMVTVEKY
jgi:hypothetical protein